MTDVIKIKRGLNLGIAGEAAYVLGENARVEKVALSPDDFNGLVLKVVVKEGESVKAGEPIFYDKNCPELKVVSPVSGVVEAVVRGERRKLLQVVIKADEEQEFKTFDVKSASSREALHALLLEAGFGALIRQRPYDVVANPSKMPKAIFVSGFDTAPLAPDYNFVVKGQGENLQAGFDTLSRLGEVYLSLPENAATELTSVKNAKISIFSGAHPAGNVGVQINKLSPVNKGETVWTLGLQEVIALGKFALSGVVDLSKFVAVTGPEVENPCYFKTVLGAEVKPLLAGKVKSEKSLRFISGNVLSGAKIEADGFLRAFDSQISVIAEGENADEFMGWLMPRFNKFSASGLYFTKLFQCLCPKKKYDFDARLLGGERAFIMSGEIEKVFPFDIMPEQLIKAMMAKNLDKMEALGAYEVAPEDFALCEFVCSSKIEIQRIVRQALDYMRKEVE